MTHAKNAWVHCSIYIGIQQIQDIYSDYTCNEGILGMKGAGLINKSNQFLGIKFLRTIGRALDARDTYCELSVLNDIELAKRGLNRNDIAKQAMAKLG